MRFTEDLFRAHRERVAQSLNAAHEFSRTLPLPIPGHGFDYTDCEEFFGEDWLDRSATTEADGLKIIVVLAFTQFLPNLRFDREWLAIRHQCGGHASDPIAMIGTRLRPRVPIERVLLKIARDRYGEDRGWFCTDNVRASQIVSYSAALGSIGLDCERSWRFLQEGIYPIDATQQILDRLAEDAPELGVLTDGNKRLLGQTRPDPTIFVLCEDCQ